MEFFGDRLARYDLEVYQGEDFAVVLDFKQPSGLPLNLSGYSAEAKLRRHYQQVVATFTCTITNPLMGQITVSLGRDRTLEIPAASYSWDLTLISPSGQVTPKLAGTVTAYYLSNHA